MRRRIVRTDAFEQALAALNESPDGRRVLSALIARIQRWPQSGSRIPGTAAQVLRSMPYRNFPGVRLIYRVAGDVIYLYHVDLYDVLKIAPCGRA